MSNQHHAAHGIKHLLEDLPRLYKKKNPIVAGFLGFFFGGIGLGLYFQSWKDFLYPVIAFVLLSIALPGLGTFAALIFTSIWGVVRAANSG